MRLPEVVAEADRLRKGARLDGDPRGDDRDINGTPSLPRRSRPKGLLPSTWLERTLKVAYVDVTGHGVEASGTLLDLYPTGPVLNIAGAKTLICWERLALCELVEY